MSDVMTPERAESFYRFSQDGVGKEVLDFLEERQAHAQNLLENGDVPDIYRYQGRVYAYRQILDLFRHAERIFKQQFGKEV